MGYDLLKLVHQIRCSNAWSRGSSRCVCIATATALTLIALVAVASSVLAQATSGAELVVRLRLSGDSAILPSIRSCLVDKLRQMPDVKVATARTAGTRFIVDIVAAKATGDNISAGLMVAQTFAMEGFRPRIKEGEDANALLNGIRYLTLLRLHELLPDQTNNAACARRLICIRGRKML
jgi:hypothetical protein